MTTYWTMGEADGIPSVTLCEDHALEATNIGSMLFGLGPWDSMSAAALELDTLTATFGHGEQIGFDFTTDEVGPCGECEASTERGVA